MKNKQEKIELITLDEKSKTKILNKIKELDNEEGEAILHLILRDTKGDPATSFEIIEAIHSSKVDLHVEAYGNIGAGGTLLMAAGKPGHRTAHPGSSFQILEGAKYSEGVDKKSLRPEDEAIVEAHIALNAKGKKLLQAITESNVVSEKTAKRLGIIDNTYKMISKYKKDRRRKNPEEGSDSKAASDSKK